MSWASTVCTRAPGARQATVIPTLPIPDESLIDMFERTVDDTPDEPAVHYFERTFTFANFHPPSISVH